MICKIFNIAKNDFSKLTTQEKLDALKKLDTVKEIYKKFEAKQIPMTTRERNFVKSAYGAEISLNIKLKEIQTICLEALENCSSRVIL